MRVMALLALACGFVAAPMVAAGNASAIPACDGVDCVPYVARNVAQGQPCVLRTRYVFGLDASGTTLICTAKQSWAPSPPLVGVRTLRAPCGEDKGVAQSPDGIPMSCIDQGWTGDYTGIYYPGSA